MKLAPVRVFLYKHPFRFRAAKIRFSQILENSLYFITLAKERKEGKQ